MSSLGQFSALKLPESSLPAVTYGMLVDFLGEERIVFAPTQTKRIFRWLKIHGKEGFEPLEGVRLGQLLNVAQADHARKILDENPEAFVCATTHDRTVPEWASDYEGRLVLVEQGGAFLYFCFLIMKLFTDSLLLCSQLDKIAQSDQGLQEALGIAAQALDARISCFDAGGAKIAEASPNGFESAEEGRSACKTNTKIIVDGSFFADLQMETQSKPSTGQMDLFDITGSHIEPILMKAWGEQAHLICPHWHLLAKLIEGEGRIAPNSDEIKLLLQEMPFAEQFKLLLLGLENAKTSPSSLAPHAKLINNGDCLVFAHRGDLCVLCFAREEDKLLSHKKTQEDAARHLSKFPDLEITSSQIFESITDLDLAYQQAFMTRKFLPLLNQEPQTALSPHRPKVTPFEICLAYYLMSGGERNERLLDFTFSHTLMQKLSQEDKENGTNHLDIFWQYLICERNATMVAERLHMHRNTVIYRMGKIQKRFDLDLADPNVREKMILDFKMFFFMNRRTNP